MEVADLWRREWAGTAEYGRVVEGGVTRRIARAMEVLHASAPGARVRVMRAAYHSSAGPGAPAESFMLHSSRRVISSGANFLESPTQPVKPLEISSTPLESSPELNILTENYKVTEPDDFDISEPSKWRANTRGSSFRMPSEESSSTDNASIIDLDQRVGKNLHRKYSYDSESSDVQFRSRSNSRTSPLLDTPVTLSTLKYKSLLNSSNEWNTRRKSYSFEDTSPLTDTILLSNDTLAMESSTDSGICKSSEIVNEHIDDHTNTKFSKDERKPYGHDESFKEWLSKNRPISHYRGTKFKSYREHDTVMEEATENNITLQSSGKVSITLPITIETENDNNSKRNYISEETDRKNKKVEFCKTEVHFAAESGKVHIIATDEKPPPSNDFRRRRSAFVPIHSMTEKPITLYGQKSEYTAKNEFVTALNNNENEFGETDENTAATKGILKNKIPKPKPYLLGENMAFGISNDTMNEDLYKHDSVLTAVSLVNKQLETEKRYDEVQSIFPSCSDKAIIKNSIFRTNNTGPSTNDNLKRDIPMVKNIKITKPVESTVSDLKNKFRALQVSPAELKPRTRPLKESDLTYFGVDKKTSSNDRYCPKQLQKKDNVVENIFHSVKLIQQVSNSVCNSEHDSDEAPEYQNLPINADYHPTPVPRLRSKYDDKPNEINEIKVLKPIIEKVTEGTRHELNSVHTRRSKFRRSEKSPSNRSISEPPKVVKHNVNASPNNILNYKDQSLRSSKQRSTEKSLKSNQSVKDDNLSDGDIPAYVNLNSVVKESSPMTESNKNDSLHTSHTVVTQKEYSKNKIDTKMDSPVIEISHSKKHGVRSNKESSSQKKHVKSNDTLTRQNQETDKAHSKIDYKKSNGELHTTYKNQDKKFMHERNISTGSKEHKSRSLQRTSPKMASPKISENVNGNSTEKTKGRKENNCENRDTSKNRGRKSSKDKNDSLNGTMTSAHKPDMNSNMHYSSPQVKKYDKDSGIKANGHKLDKRSEYVINYDDKHGTFSSIRKIKPGVGLSKRKKTSKEIFKDSHTDNTLRNKKVDKIGLLQPEDHHGYPNELNYANRKWKTKVNIQRSCQVL